MSWRALLHHELLCCGRIDAELHAWDGEVERTKKNLQYDKTIWRTHFYIYTQTWKTNVKGGVWLHIHPHAYTGKNKVENRRNQKLTYTYSRWRHYCKQSPSTICDRKHQHPFSQSTPDSLGLDVRGQGKCVKILYPESGCWGVSMKLLMCLRACTVTALKPAETARPRCRK